MNDYIKSLINNLGFKPTEGTSDFYSKLYKNYKIEITNENINYGDKIKLGDRTTCNFSSSENFVVLECVDRLLEKGYLPEKISLEYNFPMGHREKGKLDIYVADKNDDAKCYLMIECKTFGAEYDKAYKKMLSDGGQLFSYFKADTLAQYLCLYASRFDKEIEYKNAVIKIEDELRNASNVKEAFDIWSKNPKNNGIFEGDITAYDIKMKAKRKIDLNDLKSTDSGKIFNRFAEILRHNVVSDKSNAFNKIFNLFLCKIIDEDRDDSEELDFQWKDNDDHISLQKRLNDLYKNGMKKFLDKSITDYDDNDLTKELNSIADSVAKKHIEDMFTKIRLHKNNEFAFKEVFDEQSFEENAKVVKAVVKLLEDYKLRYNHKQQFLGDFFELLLNTGLKQESGQFFTPVPVAKFIVSSIPLKEVINNKIKNGDNNFLPYIIDYAAGSGHFLTEAMDEIQKIIDTELVD
jgi:type I restriction enzyme M protein